MTIGNFCRILCAIKGLLDRSGCLVSIPASLAAVGFLVWPWSSKVWWQASCIIASAMLSLGYSPNNFRALFKRTGVLLYSTYSLFYWLPQAIYFTGSSNIYWVMIKEFTFILFQDFLITLIVGIFQDCWPILDSTGLDESWHLSNAIDPRIEISNFNAQSPHLVEPSSFLESKDPHLNLSEFILYQKIIMRKYLPNLDWLLQCLAD